MTQISWKDTPPDVKEVVIRYVHQSLTHLMTDAVERLKSLGLDHDTAERMAAEAIGATLIENFMATQARALRDAMLPTRIEVCKGALPTSPFFLISFEQGRPTAAYGNFATLEDARTAAAETGQAVIENLTNKEN